MDLANALLELRARKLRVVLAFLIACAVGVALAYEVQLSPPKLADKGFQVGVANSTLIVDTEVSSIDRLPSGDQDDPFVSAALLKRAQSLARLMDIRPIRQRIAEALDISRDLIGVTLPTDPAQSGVARNEPGAGARASQIINTGSSYQLTVDDSTQAPTIRLIAQAPNAEEAIRLANASGQALARYVTAVQRESGARRRTLRRQLRAARRARENAETRQARDRALDRLDRLEDEAGATDIDGGTPVRVSTLSRATGGTVSEGTNLQLAVGGAVVTFLALCLLILVGVGAARGMRTAVAEREDLEALPDPSPGRARMRAEDDPPVDLGDREPDEARAR